MNKRKLKSVLIITEASENIGMGHVVRCLALAHILKNKFNVEFLLYNWTNAVTELIRENEFTCFILNKESSDEDKHIESHDIVVLDGYNFTPMLSDKIKSKQKYLIQIDDLHNQHYVADCIINVSDSVTKNDFITAPYTKLFLGSKYVMLRKIFNEFGMKPARNILSITSVFISMGGSDLNNNSLKALEACLLIPEINTIHIVIGITNSHESELHAFIEKNKQKKKIVLYKNLNSESFCNLLFSSQLAICPASGTCMEACAVGIGLISGYTADNQLGILNGLIKNDCAFNLGDINKISTPEIRNKMEFCIQNPEQINKQIVNQKKLIDGQSPQRLLAIFDKLEDAH
ncbi:MAG: UDP-2,4-diacetamido-2,4,6-trideoxy-beta-L-altropyranose hydrolase [Bacteroidia bacterium]